MMKVFLCTLGSFLCFFAYSSTYILYLQQIAEQKLKAFSIGTMGKRPLSKKELEEQRKKEQEQAAAQVNSIVHNHLFCFCRMFYMCILYRHLKNL